MYEVIEFTVGDDPQHPKEVAGTTTYESIADVAEALGWDDICLIPMRDQWDVYVGVTLEDLFAGYDERGCPPRFWLIAPEDWEVPFDWQFEHIVRHQLGDLQG